MCDICVLKCQSCQRTVETHIGDYSAARKDITVFCHHCREAAIKYVFRAHRQLIVFIDNECTFVLQLPRDIGLNGIRRDCVGKKPKEE